MIHIPYRKIAYISSEMIKRISEGDEELKEIYQSIMLQQMFHLDVFLITDNTYKVVKEFPFLNNSLCKEITYETSRKNS